MNEDKDKIVLPKDTQKKMMEFFLKTSIPRKKKEKLDLLSDKNQNRGEKKT